MRLYSILEVVSRRSLANWKILLAVVFGIILAVGLISATALYNDALDDLGLDYTLRQADPRDLDVKVRANTFKLDPRSFDGQEERLERRVDGALGWLIDDDSQYIKSATFYPSQPGQPIPEEDSRPRSFLQYQRGFEDHIQVVEGRLPGVLPGPVGTAAPAIEVAVSAEAAEQFGIAVGDSFDLHPFWRPGVEPLHATVVGLIEPIDLEEEFWLGFTDRFTFPSTSWDTYPLWVAEEALRQQVAVYLPDMNADMVWGFYLDLSGLDARNAPSAENGLRSIAASLNLGEQRTQVNLDLADAIDSYSTKLFFTRIPLFVLIIQVVAVVLYYLVMVATMLVERQAGEIALLKSRGAGTWQIMAVYAIEGLALAAIGIAVGPLLAGTVISWLGKTPAFDDLSGGELLEINYSITAYGMAAGGALLSVVALLIPAYRATNYSIVRYKQNVSRRQQQNPFLKYYLDLFFVVIGAILFFELQRRGSLSTETIFGERKADPLLLMTPTVFLVTIAILFHRLFPLVLHVLAWIAARLTGASVLLGLRHMTRNPGHYARLVVLLMLATSLGMFAASFGKTLDQSFQDRAGYSAGSDLRMVVDNRELDEANLRGVVETWEGVDTAALAMRTNASFPISPRDDVAFTMLGVEPEALAEVAYFREDFSGKSLSGLMEDIDGPQLPRGYQLPEEARYLGMWVYVSQPLQGGVVFAHLRDANGRYGDFGMGFISRDEEVEEGWQFMVADLEDRGFRGASRVLEPPVEVVSVAYRRFSRPANDSGQVYFDDLQWSATEDVGPEGFVDGAVIDPFEDLTGWFVSRGLNDVDGDEQIARATDRAFNGEASLRMGWSRPQTIIPQRSITRVDDGAPLGVVVSDSFLRASGLSVGDTFRFRVGLTYVDAEIQSRFEFFPTYEATVGEHFVVGDLERLTALLNRNPGTNQEYLPTEVWTDVEPGAESTVLESVEASDFRATEVFNLSEMRNSQQTDPLVAAGWKGILFISFAAILTLSAVGYLVYSFLTAQTRSLEFAILRTMGFSTRQIVAVVSFEQTFVIGLGIALGTIVGSRIGRLMLDYMGVTESGEDVLPPFQFATSWSQIGLAYGILGGVFFVAILAVVLLYSRLAVYRVLRIGEL